MSVEDAYLRRQKLKLKTSYIPSTQSGLQKPKDFIPSYQSIFSAIEDYEDGPGPGNYMMPDTFQRVSNWKNSPSSSFPKSVCQSGSVLINGDNLKYPSPGKYNPDKPIKSDHAPTWSKATSPRFVNDITNLSPGPAVYDPKCILTAYSQAVSHSTGITIGRGQRFIQRKPIGASGPGTYDVVSSFKATSSAAKSHPANVKFGIGHDTPCAPFNKYFEESQLGQTSLLGPAVSPSKTTLSTKGGLFGTSPRLSTDNPLQPKHIKGSHKGNLDELLKKNDDIKYRRELLEKDRQVHLQKKLMRSTQSLPSINFEDVQNSTHGVSFGSPSSTSRLNFRRLREQGF